MLIYQSDLQHYYLVVYQLEVFMEKSAFKSVTWLGVLALAY